HRGGRDDYASRGYAGCLRRVLRCHGKLLTTRRPAGWLSYSPAGLAVGLGLESTLYRSTPELRPKYCSGPPPPGWSSAQAYYTLFICAARLFDVSRVNQY